MKTKIDIELPANGFRPSVAAAIVKASGLAEYFEKRAGGPFGHSALGATALEATLHGLDLGICAWERLEGQIRDDMHDATSFVLPEFLPEHQQLVSTFAWVVTIDAITRRLHDLCGAPEVEGALELDGLEDVLTEPDQERSFGRMLRLGRAWLELKGPPSTTPSPQNALVAYTAFLTLLRRALEVLSTHSSARPLFGALSHRQVRVAGYPYKGLSVQQPESERAGLLGVSVADVVGNDEYVRAAMRLARDVAGFDLAAHKNPKRINPILFGLGRPGCGKTVTAHAVAHYFLDFCRERGVPAKFVVVRRTDWASSYQNASANNLVRLFREEVYGFEGVCGVYWPDIDTAFASRDSDQLRSEEKNNLAAVFGIFDGTLIPRDGKWFLICDANNMHMDEATISRIAQNPYSVPGPTESADYIRLLRDVLLRDVLKFLPQRGTFWQELGEKLSSSGLSGRNLDSIAGNIRAFVQDFEYPDAYFKASTQERTALVATLGQSVDEAAMHEFIDDFVAFQRDAETRAESDRFEDEVQMIVRRLNASRAAAERSLNES